ncbi:MAG TPA: glycosyltransferase family 39 protein, partial [Ignavibacteriaceae bacterium]|nr:glycosyltransferase family 39 protein [Ignavibacteriaceae bacterium]
MNVSMHFEKIINYKHLSSFISLFYFCLMLFIALSYHTIGCYGVETDFFWSYLPAAKSFLNGKILVDGFRGPLYPIVLGILSIITKNYFAAGIIISVFSASLVLFFTFGIVEKLTNSFFAVLIILFTAVNNHFVHYAYTAGTDMIFNALLSGAVYFFLKKELNSFNIAVSGVLSSLALLTRYNGIFLLAIIPLIFLFKSFSYKSRIKAAAVFFIAFIIFQLPWSLYSYNEKGDFFYNKNYLNTALEVYNSGTVDRENFWFG